MKKIRIVADSTCDLSPELLERFEISTIPLCIVMNDESFYDGIDVTPADIYKWADENRTTPKTAAVTYEKSIEILKPMMDAGDDIIFFGISSKMSSTCQVIRLIAAQESYSRIFVIDSENLSTGIGLQVIRAAELAAEGKTAEEIVEIVERTRGLVRASFVVDNLTYLSRGGRCTAVTALMATAFKIHPMIIVKDGAMGVSKKFRGKMEHVLKTYVEGLKNVLAKAEPARIFITHSGCTEEIIGIVKAELEALDYFDEILITQAGGVISSHCGPDTLGVLFYVKESTEAVEETPAEE